MSQAPHFLIPMSKPKNIRQASKPSKRGKAESVVRQLSGEELGALAKRMVNAKSLRKKNSLREEIKRGFYGRF